MRIEMGKNIDDIERDCDWAVPIIPDTFNPHTGVTTPPVLPASAGTTALITVLDAALRLAARWWPD